MKDYELVIFDCDGVLVDSDVLSRTCLMRVLARHWSCIALDTAGEFDVAALSAAGGLT